MFGNNYVCWLVFWAVTGSVVNGFAPESERQVPAPEPIAFRVWPSMPPESSSFELSKTITGLAFTGRYANYTTADTWYPSWGADDRLYSPFTDTAGGDGVNGVRSWSGGGDAVVGHAVIEGDNPLKLKLVEPDLIPGSPVPYGGRYPCGSLMFDGNWYLGTYALNNASYGLNWPILGPCPGFHVSKDLGKTWTPSPLSCEPGKALFPEPTKRNGPVKIGAPHFVDFGKNMAHSPDGKAYLVGHGSTEPDQEDRNANLSWITGDQIYLCRVKPSPSNINDESKYEYFAGHDDNGQALWSWDFENLRPLVDWDNNCGCVTITYNAPLKRFLMCVTDGWPTIQTMNTYILESDSITGPWKLVSYMKDFGVQAYFVNFPSKFISPDGRTAWLCYSGNFTRNQPVNPPGGKYAMSLHEIHLLAPDESIPESPLIEPGNIAPLATVSSSSTHSNYQAGGVTDGCVGGYPGNYQQEWATQGEKDTAILRLTWNQPQTIDRVWLFDRPNDLDQVLSGLLVFSDGSTVKTGRLPDNASYGLEVRFEPKSVKWLAFFVTGVGSKTQNIGLSEIAVFTYQSE